jgi:hypothetical protein
LLREAMTKDNFDRVERGLSPLKPKVVERADPKPPSMDDEILSSDVKEGYKVKLEYANRVAKKNEEGVSFMGYEVKINLLLKKETLTLKGWMIEGEFLTFVRNNREQIDQSVICW